MLKRLLLGFLLVFISCSHEDKKEDPPPPPHKEAPDPVTPPPSDPTNLPGGFPNLPGGFPIPNLPNIPIPGFPGGGMPGDTSGPATPETLQGLADAINAARKSRGLGEVAVELALNCAAKRHADDIGERKACTHTGADGSSPWDRARDCGTSADGEIVACGQGTPKAAVDAWTLSPGHAAIMYAPNQTVIGVGMLNNYWVAIFR